MVVLNRGYDAEHGEYIDTTSDTDALSTTQCEEADVLGGQGDRARSNREALNLINRLRTTGVGQDVDLPLVTAIGQQSSGKSSLLEQVSGIRFPRNAGTCTRVPIECHLSRSEEPWVCRVKIRILTSTGIIDEYFGPSIATPQSSELVDRIARAQAAVLNPSKDSAVYLSCPSTDLTQLEINFSSNIICLEISGDDVPDLTLVDLPGLIQSAGADGDAADIELVRELVVQYISRPSTIILVTVSCETDFNNQPGYQLARQCDPKGDRTFGVLTKPDRIQSGTEDGWIKLLKNDVSGAPLANGWFSVKMPELTPSHPAPPRAEATTQEAAWFHKQPDVSPAWTSLTAATRRRLGTRYLVGALEVALSDLVRRRIPALDIELREQSESVEAELRALPAVPSDDAVSEVFRLMHGFLKDVDEEVSGHTRGSAERDSVNLLNGVNDVAERFQMSLIATFPDFRPWRQGVDVKDGNAPLALPRCVLGNNTVSPLTRTGEPIFIEQVEDDIARGRKASRSGPDHIPPETPSKYAKLAIASWTKPTRGLVDETYQQERSYLLAMVNRHFGQYEHGGLCAEMRQAVDQHLSACRTQAEKQVDWLQKIDREAYTGNTILHGELKALFRTHLKGSSQSTGSDSLQRKLELRPYNSAGLTEAPTQYKNDMDAALKNLNKVGVRVAHPQELTLLQAHPDDALIDVMASASALFEIARRRFSDYAPQAVYLEQVQGFHEGLGKVLREELGLTGPEIHSKCSGYLEESPDVKARRQDLKLQYERLTAARTELNLYHSSS
ncbi:hypothetical protein PENSPDRAFT_598401 [Peniophora sp. CONT]|nr:hypothetical protein PENSPDRAFT_598401 [Peniophora sp. CONT]